MGQPSVTTGGWREPAHPAALAEMWGTVSAAHQLLEKRRSYYLTTSVDDRLGDQLTLVPVLHEWVPVAAGELGELTDLLRDYLRAPNETTRETAAARVVHAVRVMVGTRGRLMAG